MRANGHFSGSMVAHALLRPTRKSNEASQPHPSLFGLAPGGVCPTFPSPGKPVVSYTAFSPSPPSRWDGWAVVLCDTFRRITPPPCYGAPRLCGARTFLILQLSHKTRPFFLLSANIILYPTTTFSNSKPDRFTDPVLPYQVVSGAIPACDRLHCNISSHFTQLLPSAGPIFPLQSTFFRHDCRIRRLAFRPQPP